MIRVYKLTALVFMVLWVPITAHCYLEKLPGLEFLQCAADGTGNSSCEGQGCCAVESEFYKVSDAGDCVAVVPVLAVVMLPRLLDDALETDEGLAGFEILPPELPQSWQFLSRTALQIRAPSFVS